MSRDDAGRVAAAAGKVNAISVRIPPIFMTICAPVTLGTSLSTLNSLRNSKHSCNDATLEEHFCGVCGVGRTHLTDRLKVRVSARRN
ncbi:MAG: hypothetical protein EOP94_04705 [Zymomonas sp.]|nr:MAG: hypothetical protein EOP94_04705 [Zymomonas sp.]